VIILDFKEPDFIKTRDGRDMMKVAFCTKLRFCMLLLLLLAVATVKAEGTEKVAELIEQAHKHDNMYTLGPEASQQKAIGFYELALEAEPDKEQRLHILYRMGQLYGSSYQLEKGEKPDFHKAIKLYKEIVKSYPLEEPLVYKAMSSLCDHNTTLRDFEGALKWSKKILERKATAVDEQLEAGKIDKRTAEKIRRYQRIAVNQIAYTADHISYLRTHGELRAIAGKYAGTDIAKRAEELLVENMDKMPDLWMPTNDEPFSPSDSTLQAGVSSSAANQTTQDMQVQSVDSTEEKPKTGKVQIPNTEILQKEKTHPEKPRGPPKGFLAECIITAAGLIVLGLAAVIIRRRKNSF
jgi:tetratricopeptide (TPR) repeat protein